MQEFSLIEICKQSHLEVELITQHRTLNVSYNYRTVREQTEQRLKKSKVKF